METPFLQKMGINLLDGSQVAGCQIDSRLVSLGELFFAISGNQVDGHHFLEEVSKKGAIGAVVSTKYKGPDYGLALTHVEDVGDFLRNLAKESLRSFPVPIIGITGSIGKTTTKDFTATLLEKKFRVWKTAGSQNSKLTLPLTILNRPKDSEVLILEMGMSDPGDLKRLVSIAPPTIAVLTKVALVHTLAFPEGLSGIAKEKSEIFSSQKTRCAIFDQGFFEYEEIISTIKYKKRPFAKEDLKIFDKLPFEEEHILHNVAAAVCIAKEMGLTNEEIVDALPQLKTPPMRFQREKKRGIHFINDAYNAGPDATKAALKSLSKFEGKKVAVLGSMKDLGVFCKKSHREVGLLARDIVDELYSFGEEAKELFEAFIESKKTGIHFETKEALEKHLKAALKPGDVVLVKGSRSLGLDTVLNNL